MQILLIAIAPIYFGIYNLRYHLEQTALCSVIISIVFFGSLVFNHPISLLFFFVYILWGTLLVRLSAMSGSDNRKVIPYTGERSRLVLNKPVKGLMLQVFQTGEIRTGSWGVYDGPSTEIVMDQLVFLISHPTKGYVLFEVGIHPDVAVNPVEYVGPFMYFGGLLKMQQRKGQDIVTQLTHRDIPPDSIQTIIISHLHPEHTGAVELFPEPDVVVDEQEYSYAMKQPKYNYFKKEYSHVKHWKPLSFKNATPFPSFPGSIDYFGDGSLWIVSTPGHTPGSISVLLNLPEGPVFLVGDIIWKQENIDTKTIGMPFVSVDAIEHRKAVGRLMAFMEANPDVLIVPTHDKRNIEGKERNDIVLHR